jgi:hypothetical protein
MAKLNDDAQWIMLMAFIICVALFFLALIINESTLVGQTTAEGVLEFPKSDIQDLRNEIFRIREVGYINVLYNDPKKEDIKKDIQIIAIQRKGALVDYSIDPNLVTDIHYNNGVTQYNERYF